MSGKFEVFRSEADNQFYFRLKSGNGKIILHSEGYTTKNNCLKGIQSVKKNSVYESTYLITPTHFSLKSRNNGQIIAQSQHYGSESARDNGIVSVRSNAPVAMVFDLTKIKK